MQSRLAVDLGFIVSLQRSANSVNAKNRRMAADSKSRIRHSRGIEGVCTHSAEYRHRRHFQRTRLADDLPCSISLGRKRSLNALEEKQDASCKWVTRVETATLELGCTT